MATWNETDQFLEVSRPDGQVVKIAKTPTFMAPGGQYEELKRQHETANAPKPSPFDAFDSGMDPNAAINQQAEQSLPPLAQAPTPDPIASGQTSPSQEGTVEGGRPGAKDQQAQQIPFGFESGSSTTFEGMSSSAKRALNESYKATEEAFSSGLAATQSENEARIASAEAVKAQANLFSEQEKIRQAENERRAADWQARVDEAEKKYASSTIDSGRLWANSSTGSKIAAGVGIMLGALGQALNGKDNAALKVIERAVDQDIEIQKANMAKAGNQAASTRSAYADFLRATGDERAARAAMQDLALKNIEVELGVKLAKLADSKAAANVQAQLADIQNRRAEFQATKDTVKSTQTTAISPIKGAAGTPGQTNFSESDEKEMTDRLAGIQMLNELDTALQDPNTVKNMGPVDGRLLGAASKFGFEVPAHYTKLKGETGLIVTSILKRMSGQGVTESEFNRWRELLPQITDNPENARQKLNNFIEKEKREYANARLSKARRYTNPAPFLNAYPDLNVNQNAGFTEQ